MQNAGSLVKYHTPILVNTIGTKNLKKGVKKGGNSEKQTTQTEDILNSILPPRCVRMITVGSMLVSNHLFYLNYERRSLLNCVIDHNSSVDKMLFSASLIYWVTPLRLAASILSIFGQSLCTLLMNTICISFFLSVPQSRYYVGLVQYIILGFGSTIVSCTLSKTSW